MTIPDFLVVTLVRQNAIDAGLDQTVLEQLIALAARIAAEPALRRCAEQLFAQTYQKADVTIEPAAEALFGAEVNKLYLLLAVDAVRQLRAVHEQRGIPEAITLESYGALSMSARRFAEWHNGQAGLEAWVLRHWFNVVASGELYRLGRMEFLLEPFEGNIRVYRHKQSRRVQALAEEGMHFTADGYLPFEVDEATYLHYGYALRAPQQLPKAEWELVLRNGDTVLDMHIPNFMPLRLDLLHASLKRAMDFFPRYHPERPFKAFVCSSWLFNTQWVEMLPAHSNILAFQRQGYLFPLSSNGAGGMYFIFGDRRVDLDRAPQDTGLRRAVLAHMQAGGKLRNGGFLLLPEAVEKFGQEPYRLPPIEPQLLV